MWLGYMGIINDYRCLRRETLTGRHLVDESTLWILGTKNTEPQVQFLNICIQYSSYKKLSPTLWTVEGTALHFLISKEDWEETVTEGI